MAGEQFTGSRSRQVQGPRLDVEMKKRADARIGNGGALTNSKRPESFVKGFYPTHLHGGKGVHVVCSRNFQYIDYCCGLGSNLLGYGHNLTTLAAVTGIQKGPTLSFSTIKEVELAEAISNLMPFVHKMRFLKTGSEGCSAAIRIARAATGKNVVLSEGYHGWSDEFVSLTPPAVGVPPHPYIKPLSPNLDIGDDVAAVILEPVMTDVGELRIAWLRRLREICTQKNVVLIFDETITALRFPKFCVANFLGIHPDLIVFGKALANGLPISCVGGRADIMDADYFVSSTFSGDMAATYSAIATLQALHRGYDINHLWRSAARFQEKFNALSPDIKIEGYATRGVLRGEDLPKALFLQEACRAGLLFGASWFYAFPHIDLEDQVINTLKDVFMKLSSSDVKLEGELPRKPFAQKVREGKAS